MYQLESLDMRPENSILTYFPGDSPLHDPVGGHSPNLEITDMKKILGLETGFKNSTNSLTLSKLNYLFGHHFIEIVLLKLQCALRSLD